MATYFDPPIRRMRVEAFRGFRDSREFNLGASAVIVTGPNGTGKTSFFDAIQWCLLGSVERLEHLRAKKNVEHLVNQYRLGGHAAVEMDLVISGREITIRRTGDYAGSTLEFRHADANSIFGEEAEKALHDALIAEGDMSLEVALSTAGLMQQDVMRSVLEAKPADRFRHLSSVLGLSRLEDFEEAARELAREAKVSSDEAKKVRDTVSNSVEEARQRWKAATDRLHALPELESLRRDILADSGRERHLLRVRISESDLLLPSACREAASVVGSVIDQFESFSRAHDQASRMIAPDDPEPVDEDLLSLQAAKQLAEAKATKESELFGLAEARYSAAMHAGEEMAKLASTAIPLLTENCPVCGQTIDPEHVEAELRVRSRNSDSMLELLAERDRTRTELETRRAHLATLREQVARTQNSVAAWSAYRSARARASEAFVSLGSIHTRVTLDTDDEQLVADGGEKILGDLRAIRRKLLELLNALERGPDQGAVQRAASEAAGFEALLDMHDQNFKSAQDRANQLKALSDSAIKSRTEVTERRFSAIQPLVADIFGRLDPHPAFKTIEFELDTYYRRGTTSAVVRDVLEGIAADPLVVFSTSQANIAALSYFLAMGISIGAKGLPFVLLDDPVQSMDDVNVLGFADLCRHLRIDRQLIISTHDRRFAGLMERKLAPRAEIASTEVIEFVGWDRSGPAVEQRTVAPQFLGKPIRVVKLAS